MVNFPCSLRVPCGAKTQALRSVARPKLNGERGKGGAKRYLPTFEFDAESIGAERRASLYPCEAQPQRVADHRD